MSDQDDLMWLRHRFEMAKSDVRWWTKLLDEAIAAGDWAKVKTVHYEMSRAAPPQTGGEER